MREKVVLASYTTFRIGGPARFLYEAGTDEALVKALEVVRESDLPYLILGGGSNVLIADEGFDGLVILTRNSYIEPSGIFSLRAGAGTPLIKVVEYTTARGLAGLEGAAGIPGTVGGAVRGNAGAYGTYTKDVILKTTAFDMEKGRTVVLNKEECRFAHKTSVFKEKPSLVILSSSFSFEGGDPEEMKKRVGKVLDDRLRKLPLEHPSAGCLFQNVEGRIEDEVLVERFPLLERFNGKGIIPSGYLIDRASAKGIRKGDAQISNKHANFFLNKGRATAREVAELAELARAKVRDTFSIELTKEVEFVNV